LDAFQPPFKGHLRDSLYQIFASHPPELKTLSLKIDQEIRP